MEEKMVYLSNGDLLIKRDEGYFISYGGDAQPKGIDNVEGERLLFETCEQLKVALESVVSQKGTKVKFLREIDVVLQDDEIEEDERNTSFSICECTKCHWKFIGECERHGYGFTSQGVQIPDFCPMCGSKIEDTFDED